MYYGNKIKKEETVLEENAFDKLKSMMNNGNIPEDLKSMISNMNSSNKDSNSSNNNGISPETISNLMSMFNSKANAKGAEASSETAGASFSTNNTAEQNSGSSNNTGIDFETIMKFKTIMDKMNSRDDPRSKLLISLKPYLKDSRKSKIDQYVQFLNMSKVIDIFSKSNGDDKS